MNIQKKFRDKINGMRSGVMMSAGLKTSAMIVCFAVLLFGFVPADAATVILDSATNTTATVTLNSPSATDFYVFGDNVRKSGGPSAFTDVSSDGGVGFANDSPVGIAWTGGDPVASSAGSSSFDYGTFGSSYSDRSTYALFTLTMPSTSETLDFWLRPNGNGVSLTYDVTVGDVNNSYTDTSDNDDLQHFTYSISGATINEVITVRIDNVAGSSGWHNVGFMAAQVSSSSTDSDGDLTSAAGVTEPVALPSIADTAGEAVNIFDFTLTDGGSADGLTLDVSEIVLHTSGTGDFSKVTWRLNGPDASDVTGVYGGGNTVTFSGLAVSVADGASETYTVNAYYSDNTGLTDGQTYVLSTDGDTDLTVDAAKTRMTTTTEVSNSTGTAVDIAGTLLAFGTQPADTPAGSNISDFTVEVRDAFGNVDTDSTASVTLSLSSNPGTSVLTGTNPVSAVSGVATFGDISPDKIGTGYTFDAASVGLTSGTCGTFSITTAAPVLDSGGSPALTGITEDIADGSDTGTLVSAVIASLGGTGITDSDPGQAEGIAVTAVDNTGGNWQFDPAGGTSWTNFSAVLPSDSSATLLAPAANIRFVPDADYNGIPEITFRAWDQTLGTSGDTGVDVSANGGATPYSSATETASVTVMAVNDQPAFLASSPSAVNEDAGAQTVSGWATFDAGPANEDGGQSVSAYTVSNVSSPGLFSAGPAVDISGNLTYTPAADANGSSTFEVAVQDSGGTANGGTDTSAIQTFTITVNAVNDAPVITGQNALDTNEDTALSLGLTDMTVTDIDSSYPTGFSMTVLTGANYMTSGNTVTPAANFNGTLTVPVTVNDGAAESSVFALTVTVNPVDDPPVAAEPCLPDILMADNDPDAAIGLGGLFTDIDNDASEMTFSASSGNSSVVAASVSGNTLTLACQEDQPGETAVTVTAASGGKTATCDFSVTVTLPGYTLSGKVTYLHSGIPVPGTLMTLEGPAGSRTVTTDEAGVYSFDSITEGENVVITPFREEALTPEILGATDASGIEDIVFQVVEPTEAEMKAADVTRNGTVGSMDASRLVRFSTGLVTVMSTSPEAVPDALWIFGPDSAALTVTSDTEIPDFVAAMPGDLSGNWTPDSGRRSVRESGRVTEITVFPGEYLTVPVVLSQETLIRGIDIVAEFDGDVLDATDVTLAGGILENEDYQLVRNMNNDGTVLLAIYARSQKITGSGTLVTLNFDVVGRVSSGASLLTLTKFRCNEIPVSGEYYGNRDDAPVSGGFLMNGDVSLTLGLTVEPGYDSADYDLNGDGILGMKDAIQALQRGEIEAAVRALQCVTGR